MKILLWDVETWPLIATSWTLFPKEPLSHQHLVRDFGLICGAWKWLGKREVHAVSIDPEDPENDRPVIEGLHKALSEADVIVAHNGDKFDIKKFNARAIYYGLPPIPPIRTIDTLKVAKKYFAFTSNRLDAIGKFLGVGRKIGTSFSLWQKVMKGDAKALAYMVRYNKQDVRLLEAVYKKLRPYMQNHPNENLHKVGVVCPVCGSTHVKKQGFKYNRTTVKQQYQCQKDGCRAWFSGEKVAGVKVS